MVRTGESGKILSDHRQDGNVAVGGIGAHRPAQPLMLLLAGGGYLIFLIFFLPLYAISLLVTSTGAWLVLLGGVYMIGRGLTRMITFPGASKQIQRDIELEYTKSVSNRLGSFANSLRLWLQLVRDVTVVPSSMVRFRALDEEIKRRVRGGDIWMLTRALEELISRAKATAGEATGRERVAGALANPAAAAAAVAAAAGPNALAPSAVDEAETVLECLSSLLPALEEASKMAAKLPECSNTHDFDRARQVLLTFGIGGNDRISSSVFGSLEGIASKLLRLSRELRRRKNKNNSNSSLAATAAAAATDESGVDLEEEGANALGVPTEEEGGSPKESIFAGTNLIKSWWNARYPYEGAAGFGLMREEMLIKNNAQQIWLTMPDGTMLDCCFARAYGGRRNVMGGVDGQGHGVESNDIGDGEGRRSTGCVLFCNPNAAHYESMALAGDGSRNWVSFYTSVGCDVFLFNYRGYGRSGGKASPSSITKDVREVVAYLREQMGVTRLAVHGESIGGVAAASVARHCQVDFLVLDRSFSSLSAIAQRLLGRWTKWAIWGFTGWEADVASDYLACRCYKVLACDPDDVIVADPSSTKAGVAVMMELGASSSALDVYQPPMAYRVADHTRSCPPVERVSLPMSPQERLSEMQITHFTACLRYIGRRAPRVGQANSDPLSAGGNRRRGSRRGDLTMNLEAQGGTHAELEMVSMIEDGDQAEDHQEEHDDPVPDPLTEKGKVDVTRPLGEAWVLLSRIDGLCGRMLGRAVAKGFDDMRAWVCCLVVHGSVMRSDVMATAANGADAVGSLPVEVVSQRLQTLLENHPDELGTDPFVEYVSHMLLYLVQRVAPGMIGPALLLQDERKLKHCGRRKARAMPATVGHGLVGGTRAGGGHGRGAVQDAPALASLEKGHHDYDIELTGDGRDDLLAAAPSSPSSPSSSGAGHLVGKVLSLRCGHNNPYSESERRMLLEHLALEGWVAPDRKALDILAKAGSTQQ